MNALLDRRSMCRWMVLRAIVSGVSTFIFAQGVRAAEGIAASDAVHAPTPRTARNSDALPAGVSACDIAGASNCHEITAGSHHVVMSDWAVPLRTFGSTPLGVRYADDFMPATTAIDTICTWGTYLDPNAPSPNGCAGQVEDDFVIRVYENNNGIPGALIAQRDNHPDYRDSFLAPCALATCPGPVTVSTAATALVEPVNGNPVFAYTLTFPQIELPLAGVAYWLEIANNTYTPTSSPVLTPNTCYWHISSSDPVHGDPYNGWCAVTGAETYDELSGRWRDLLWCLGGKGEPVAVAEPATPTGACCDCDGNCQENVTMYDCADNTPGSARRWLQFEPGTGKEPATCAGSVCAAPAGDTCAAAAMGTIASRTGDPVRGSAASGCAAISNGQHMFDSACATTDGFSGDYGSGDYLGKDLWWCYTTTCTGEVVASTCASSISYGGFDSYLAVYHDFDNPTECPCPGDSQAFEVAVSNEGCNGILDGGGGYFDFRFVRPGECWLFRVGGWGNAPTSTDSGHGTLNVECNYLCNSVEPEHASLEESGGDQQLATNRFLAIKVGEAPPFTVIDQFIRVTAIDLPGDFSVWNGQQWWVGQPHKVCEKADETGGTNCGAVPGQPKDRPYNWYAPLLCDPPFSALGKFDWNAACESGSCAGGLEPGMACTTDEDCRLPLFLYHEGIVPTDENGTAIYAVQTLSVDCVKSDPYNYSRPLMLTQPQVGDLVGFDLTQCPRPASEGAVGLPDVLALLQKFSNAPCQIKKARGDLSGLTSGVPDFRVNLSDINGVLLAFATHVFPFAPADPNNPCHLDGIANTLSIRDGPEPSR